MTATKNGDSPIDFVAFAASCWFGGFDLERALDLAGRFTLAQMLAHETFRKRYESGGALTIRIAAAGRDLAQRLEVGRSCSRAERAFSCRTAIRPRSRRRSAR